VGIRAKSMTKRTFIAVSLLSAFDQGHRLAKGRLPRGRAEGDKKFS
jgi:hypothetical protein